MIAAWLALACSDYAVYQPARGAPTEPPGRDGDDRGEPPDWTDCQAGYLGQYFNHGAGFAAIEDAVGAPDALGWWAPEDLGWQRFDQGLDFGGGWWPVDDGLADDPAWFSGRWLAWIRAYSDGPVELLLGASTDAWVIIDGEVAASVVGADAFEPALVALELDAGQYPLEALSAHRGADVSGMSFRFASGDVALCYPEY